VTKPINARTHAAIAPLWPGVNFAVSSARERARTRTPATAAVATPSANRNRLFERRYEVEVGP